MPPSVSLHQRPRPAIAAAATFVIACVVVFLLPLHVPVAYRPIVSASYIAGFNNPAAAVLAATFSVLVFLLTLRIGLRSPPAPWIDSPGERLGKGFIAAVVGLSALVLAVCGLLVAASHLGYLADAGYFIEQATVRQDTGRALYTQLEFAYGPLLLLPEVWLAGLLHCSMTTAYFVTLVLSESLGVWLLAYVLNELPLRGSLRRAALALFALGAITPLLGLNYTFLRFAPPLAVLLFGTRGRSPVRCALMLTGGEIVVLLLSPELGLALAAGVIAFTTVRVWREGVSWLPTAVLPIAALATLLLTLGRPYLAMIATFSGGTLNLPVAPYPHLLVLVFALAWVLPVGLGRGLDLRQPLGARLIGFYALSLAYLPAALGRCDPLHVFFNATGLLILSLVAVSRSSPRVRKAWLGCILLLVLWEQAVNARFYEYRTARVLAATVMPRLPPGLQAGIVHMLARRSPDMARVFASGGAPEYRLDVAALESVVGSAPVATPLEVSPAVREALRDSHHAQPGYFGYWVDVLSAASEQRSIGELNTATWALLPSDWQGAFVETPWNIRDIQGFVFRYPQQHPVPYALSDAFKQNLAANWTPVYRFGPYTLYRSERGPL